MRTKTTYTIKIEKDPDAPPTWKLLLAIFGPMYALLAVAGLVVWGLKGLGWL